LLGDYSKVVVREVFEVLYSPVKAFRKIIEKPDFKGVLLVLVIVVSSMVVVQYVAYSKLFFENRTPENDDWTESLTNQHNWLSNGTLSTDGTDYKMGNTDGNHSIASSISNNASVWMKLTDIDPVNCSEETGYTELFFWIKWINENESSPNSGTLKLFSSSEDSYFETDITSFLASNGEWTNATLNVGSGQGWTSNSSPDWQNITGLEFSLDWASSANLTIKIDGLFFRKFSSPIYTGEFAALILPVVLQVLLPFAINWILWSGLLIIVGRLFQEDLGKWNVFFVIMGYAFITTFVYTLANGLLVSTLPPLNVPLDPTAASAALNKEWGPLLAYQVTRFTQLLGELWIAALGSVVIHVMKETPWSRATTIAAVAFGIRFLLSAFLGI
jgi:hypothetical protein